MPMAATHSATLPAMMPVLLSRALRSSGVDARAARRSAFAAANCWGSSGTGSI